MATQPTVSKGIKNATQVVEALKKEASSNKTFNAIALVWAMRERARYAVTIGTLRLTLSREGYHFERDELEKALSFLANLGVGKLHMDAKGKITGLTDLKYTLQSIGKAAVGESKEVEKFHQGRRFQSLPINAFKEPVAAPEAAPTAAKKIKVYLTADINGKHFNFPIPGVMTSEEVLELVSDLGKE